LSAACGQTKTIRFALVFAGIRDALGFFAFALASEGERSQRRWFGLLVFSLASALCLRASSVAPVRGGTYFSLPPQRKVAISKVEWLMRLTRHVD
jgi:hypothetical protein